MSLSTMKQALVISYPDHFTSSASTTLHLQRTTSWRIGLLNPRSFLLGYPAQLLQKSTSHLPCFYFLHIRGSILIADFFFSIGKCGPSTLVLYLVNQSSRATEYGLPAKPHPLLLHFLLFHFDLDCALTADHHFDG